MLFDQVNVIYSRPLKGFGALLPEHAEMISKVSPKIKLRDVSRLVEAENHGDAAASKQLDDILAETDVMYGFPPPANLLTRAPRLKWIQNPLVGVEMFLKPDFVASSVKLTNARGIHDQVAEIALMLALMLAKNVVSCLNQKEHHTMETICARTFIRKNHGRHWLGAYRQPNCPPWQGFSYACNSH